MEITLITPGKIKQDFFAKAEAEYLTRLRRFCSIQIVEVKEEKLLKHADIRSIKRTEAERIREKIPAGAAVIALDERGKNPDSRQFAEELKKLSGINPKLTFVIGGANGLGADLLTAATVVYSLGKMTLSQDLARVVFLEQIYRAFTINAGLPYHRE